MHGDCTAQNMMQNASLVRKISVTKVWLPFGYHLATILTTMLVTILATILGLPFWLSFYVPLLQSIYMGRINNRRSSPMSS